MQRYKNSLSFQTDTWRVSGINLELVIILAFLDRDILKRCDRSTGGSNAISTGASEKPSNVNQLKTLHKRFPFSFPPRPPPAVKAVGVQSTLKTLPLELNLAIFVIHSHVFIHHDQSLPWVAQSFQGHSLASCYGQYNLHLKKALSLPMPCLNSDHSFYVFGYQQNTSKVLNLIIQKWRAEFGHARVLLVQSFHYINTVLCLIKVISNTIELIAHTSC